MTTPPGWYPDPWRQAPWRWWDGQQWTSFATSQQPFTGSWTPRRDPAAALASEERMHYWAKVAVWTWVAAQAAGGLIMGFALSPALAAMRKAFHAASTGAPLPASSFQPTAGYNLAFDALGLVYVGVGVAFLVWQDGAAETARDLGYPARRTPGLGVVSWFLPVVSLWFPYQALRDCLPPGHPARRTALHAWLAYVASPVLATVAALTELFAGAYALVPFALAVACLFTAAALGVPLIDVIRDDHRRAVTLAHLFPQERP